MSLTNKIVYLKPLTLKHKQSFYKLFNDKDISKYLSMPYPLTMSWTIDYIKDAMEKQNTNEKKTWGLFKCGTDELLGVMVLKDIDEKNKTARIGYSVGKKYWNNGYTLMGVRLVLNFAYNDLNLNRIEVRVDTDDAKSIKLINYLGGVKEGLMRQASFFNGVYKDLYLYSILKEEYYEKINEKKLKNLLKVEFDEKSNNNLQFIENSTEKFLALN